MPALDTKPLSQTLVDEPHYIHAIEYERFGSKWLLVAHSTLVDPTAGRIARPVAEALASGGWVMDEHGTEKSDYWMFGEAEWCLYRLI